MVKESYTNNIHYTNDKREKFIDDELYILTNHNNIQIYTVDLNDEYYKSKYAIEGSIGDIINTVVKTGIHFKDLDLSRYNSLIKHDFIKSINDKSYGFIVDIKIKIVEEGLIFFFTLCFSNDIDALNFKHFLLNKVKIKDIFKNSFFLKHFINFELYEKYQVNILKKNIEFYLINVNSYYNKNYNTLTISLNTYGLYHCWNIEINDQVCKTVHNTNKVDIKIHLKDVYKMYICVYNTYMDLLKDKLLLIDPYSNLESNISTIYKEKNTLIISVLDNTFCVDGIQQPHLNLKKNTVYLFDQNNSTNSIFPMFIYNDKKQLYENVSYYLNGVKHSNNTYKNNFCETTFRYFKLSTNSDESVLYYDDSNLSDIGGIITIE